MNSAAKKGLTALNGTVLYEISICTTSRESHGCKRIDVADTHDGVFIPACGGMLSDKFKIGTAPPASFAIQITESHRARLHGSPEQFCNRLNARDCKEIV